MPTQEQRARRALLPALGPGTRLAGRYRLTDRRPPRAGDPDEAQRWAAVDEVLARPVHVLALPAHGRRATAGRELLEAAAAAGTVRSPVLTSVYDAALEAVPAERYGRPAGAVDVAYVVGEHVEGASLAEVLRDDGPLEPEVARDAALQVAEALVAVHARGVVHGGLSPDALLLDGEGVRLADTAVAGALARRAEDVEPTTTAEQDVRALAACTYAMLTARWPAAVPEVAPAGLPRAPRTGGRDGRLCSPRQVRAGVPRALDAVVVQALEAGSARPVRTAEELLARLRAAADADAVARLPVPRRRRVPAVPEQLRRRLLVVGSVVLIGLVGLAMFAYGRELGTVAQDGGELEALVQSTPSPVPGDDAAGSRVDLAAPGVALRAFDPPPGDGRENDAAVPNAVDGDAGTAWTTERYDTTRLGGLKPGVGLLLDLGQPRAIEQLELGLEPGVDVELRVADEPSDDLAAYRVVAGVTDAQAVARLVPDAPVTARVVLVWFTRLPPADDGFRGTVRELFLVAE